MFRINRDIRFSKNKDPYKTNVGLIFPFAPVSMDARPIQHPCLYLHISYGETFIAGGIHMPSPQDLRHIRNYISENYDNFISIINKPAFKEEFGAVLSGNILTKVPKGFSLDNPAANYLKLKEFTVVKSLSHNDILDKSLPSLLEHSALALEPFNRLLFRAMYGV